MQKRYTQKAKIQTLRILEKNNFVLLRTEKQTGVRRQTIKVWAAEYGIKVFSGRTPLEEALETTYDDFKANDTQIVQYYYALRMKALVKLSYSLDQETRPDRIIEVLRYISEELNQFSESGKEKHFDGESYLKIINDNLKAAGYGLTDSDLT